MPSIPADMPITSAELADFRADFALLRTDAATVLRPVLVAGTETWQQVHVYACRRAKDIIPPRREDIVGKQTSVTSVVFGFATDVDILPSDRLQVGSVTYEVQGLDEPDTIADLERLVHCLKYT